jgi:hypothetical protein
MDVTAVGSSSAIELVEQALAAHLRRDSQAVIALYHPGARLITVSSRGNALGVVETMAALSDANDTIVYGFRPGEARAIDEHAAYNTGRVVRRGADGGVTDSDRVWLYTALDGLIYRVAVYPTARAAEQAYADHGITLGIDD